MSDINWIYPFMAFVLSLVLTAVVYFGYLYIRYWWQKRSKR